MTRTAIAVVAAGLLLAGPAQAQDSAWMTGLLGDHRARQVNDLVTVRVIEAVSALGTADANLDKSSSGSASLSSFFGLQSRLPSWIDPTSLASFGATTDFSGSGSTTRTAALSAVLTARVVDVLPNGDLVVEGIREIDINGDRQTLVLSGIIRPVDIGPGNVVLSTQIGQMQIRYFGNGLIEDNLSPGWLVRILNKIF